MNISTTSTTSTTSTFTPALPPLDLVAATLVRPGTFAEVARLARLGGRILHRGSHVDASGATWPCVTVRLGRSYVVIVLADGGADGSREGSDGIGERRRHPPGAVAWPWPWPVARVERVDRMAA